MTLQPQKDSWEHAAHTIIKNFQRRSIDACYCPDSASARAKVKELLKEGSTVTCGGSETLTQTGIMDLISQGPYRFLNRKAPDVTYGQIVEADYFLTSTNAFTLDGELINIDGSGNRVACLIHGPKEVIVVAGMNKMAANVEEGLRRVRLMASPPNALRLGISTPCTKTGVCGDCLSPDCICCQTVITRKSRIPGRIKVILVGEPLGY